MDQSTFIKKLAIWVAIVGAVIALVIGLCFGKQVETTLFGEISKWIVMSAAVIGIVECFIFSSLGGETTQIAAGTAPRFLHNYCFTIATGLRCNTNPGPI